MLRRSATTTTRLWPTGLTRHARRNPLSTLGATPSLEDAPNDRRRPSAFEVALVSGGDDRSALSADLFRNKYNVSPWPLSASALFRGSCTCNPPTQRGYEAAERLFGELTSGSKTYAETTEAIRDRLAAAFELPEGTEVVLCPSGSDAEYIPVAIAAALGAQRIGTVVSQHREIGAGSAPAAGLEYFSTSTPLGGNGSAVTVGALVGGTTQQVERISLPARDADGGALSEDAATQMRQDWLDAFFFEGGSEKSSSSSSSSMAIVHTVFGGKTGLQDAAPPKTSATTLGVVDACQGRFTNSELRAWLEDAENLVLITGSKFYRGPPFSGAVLVPKRIAEALKRQNGAPALVGHLSEFLCPDDLPEALASWRAALPPSNSNLGLALRWEAALAEIEHAAPYSSATADAWAATVVEAARPFASTLQVFETHRCIVSLKLRASETAPFFSPSDLRKIYEWMTLDVSAAFDAYELISSSDDDDDVRQAASTLCSIGQPVEVATDVGVLRLALGADSFDDVAKRPEVAGREDRLLLTKLDLLAANFERLQDAAAQGGVLVPPAE